VTYGHDLIHSKLSRLEFTFMMSMVMAVTALAIDMMLPAFGDMRAEFGLAADSNTIALVVTVFLLGLGFGQPLWGPLSDSLGRKPVLYAGLAVYVIGALGAALSGSLTVLLVARFIGGFGAAGPRVVSQGVVRDAYKGEAMAKVMSYVMAAFILIPILAPSIGAAILAVGTWHTTFIAIAAFGIVVGIWTLRLPETLPEHRRIPLSFAKLGLAARSVMANRFTMGLTFAQAVIFGFFASYLASSQLFIDDIYGLDDLFPFVFGAQAVVLGIGMMTNPRLLDRFGLRRILRSVFITYLVMTIVLLTAALAFGGAPPFWLFVGILTPTLFAHSLLIPNLRSAALIPMGAIAGTAAAVIGSITTLGGAIIGASIDSTYNGTLTPWAIGGTIAASLALGLFLWSERVWETAVTYDVAVGEPTASDRVGRRPDINPRSDRPSPT